MSQLQLGTLTCVLRYNGHAGFMWVYIHVLTPHTGQYGVDAHCITSTHMYTWGLYGCVHAVTPTHVYTWGLCECARRYTDTHVHMYDLVGAHTVTHTFTCGV